MRSALAASVLLLSIICAGQTLTDWQRKNLGRNKLLVSRTGDVYLLESVPATAADRKIVRDKHEKVRGPHSRRPNLLPGVVAHSWQDFAFGSLSCNDGAALLSFMHESSNKGVALMSLSSGLVQWEAAPTAATVLAPVVAGETVAVVTPESNTVSAFAIATGEPRWQRKNFTQLLDSDGTYFYVLGSTGVIEALDPTTGEELWNKVVPYSGYFISSYHVHNNRLYTNEFVLDLSRRTVVHRWPLRHGVDSMAFGGNGRIYVGDASGMVRIYSRSFKLLRKIRVSHADILELGVTETGFIVAGYQNRSGAAAIKVLRQEGRPIWLWEDAFDFVITGGSIVALRPEDDGYLLISRDLFTARLNWKTGPGEYMKYLTGPIAVCGQTVYASDRVPIRGFDLGTGKETVVGRGGTVR